MSINNYIPISRRLFEHRFWCDEREYSRFEAWLYLLKESRYEDSKTYVGNKVITVKRGQVYKSVRTLSAEWKWSTKKVLGFFDLLVSDDMIKKETLKETGQTIISICNYDKYNANGEGKETLNETARKQQGNSKETLYNKDNNIKSIILSDNEKNPAQECASPTQTRQMIILQNLEKRKNDFMNDCATYVETYGRAMIRAFFDHWTEPNKSKSKMRFELEKTWDLERRLKKWESNEPKFSKNGNKSNKQRGCSDEELSAAIRQGFGRAEFNSESD